MEGIMQIAALAVTAVLCAAVIRRGAPEAALVLVLAAGCWMLMLAAGALGSVVEAIGRLAGRAGLDSTLVEPVLKTGGHLHPDQGDGGGVPGRRGGGRSGLCGGGRDHPGPGGGPPAGGGSADDDGGVAGMKQVLTVVAVMLLLAMPCRAAGEPEQVEGLDELWQAAESYGVEPDGDLSGGLSGLAEQALGQAGELLRRSAQTGLKLLAVAVFCGLAEGVYAGKREGGLQAVQMAGALAVTALSVSDMADHDRSGAADHRADGRLCRLLLPVVAVLTAATGAATGAAVRQGATVLFSDLLIGAIDTLLVPIVYAYVAVCAAHAAVGNEGLKKLASVLKWVVTSLLTARPAGLCGLSHRQPGPSPARPTPPRSRQPKWPSLGPSRW